MSCYQCRVRWIIVTVMGVLAAMGCAGMEAPSPMPLKTPTPDPPNGSANHGGSPEYLAGMNLFQENCSQCHGQKGTGSDLGPPLIHEVYYSYHHPDFAFRAAIKRGVQAHHWNFGNMPSVPDLSEENVENIICYVRSLQRDSGMPVAVAC